VSFQWDEYLALAKELSQKGGEAATRSAISRAYYAAYHAARRHRACRNALATRGSHGDVWNTLRGSGNPDWRVGDIKVEVKPGGPPNSPRSGH
jgi:hypothetical protein